ncbi:hypothetical protein BGV70_22900 [Burkholderia ubonensis]|nr:hypothetical protein WJ29_30730 [Burkholderia ubonensis]OJA33981.1 hypothetical protein BGX87_10445 [Burkholderia ubonensis]OJA64216.1 hypothetical protein BGV70_22900 [Burkholderia ubonensis]
MARTRARCHFCDDTCEYISCPLPIPVLKNLAHGSRVTLRGGDLQTPAPQAHAWGRALSELHFQHVPPPQVEVGLSADIFPGEHMEFAFALRLELLPYPACPLTDSLFEFGQGSPFGGVHLHQTIRHHVD